MADSNLDFLSRLPLFQELSLDEISILDQYLGLLELAKGDTVFDEGESGEFVCFVVNGELEVLKKSLGGDSSTITKLGKGQTIGEMALIDAEIRSATVTSKTDCQLAVIDQSSFNSLLKHVPDFTLHVMNVLAGRLKIAYEMIED